MQYISYVLFRLLSGLLRLLPRRLLAFCIYVTLRLSRYRLPVIAQNLHASFPDWSNQQVYDTTVLFYKNLATVVVSQLHAAPQRSVKYHNMELLHEQAKQHKAVILLGSHFGCWETLGKAITPLLGDYNQFVAYKKLKNPYVNKYLLKRRSDTPAVPIEMNTVYKNILTATKQPKSSIYYLIADQYPSSLQNIVECDFLHQTTRWVNGPEKLAKRLNTPVLFMDVQYDDRTTVVDLHPVYIPNGLGSTESVTETYAKLLQRQIMRSPHHWLWSHKRWKNLRK